MDLNELLKSAMAAKAERDRAAATKVKLRDSRLSTKERDTLQDQLRAFESEHDYVAVALVFRQFRFSCKACQSSTLAGGQVLQQEKHRRIAGTQRFLGIHSPFRQDLPRVSDITIVQVEICKECAPAINFPEV